MKNLYKIENELYIVDNTEEINKDTKTCWCIDISCNELVLHQGVLPSYHYKHYKKIIMTTDKSINVLCSCGKDCGAKESGVQGIDDEFLEWFVKNPSCEEVEVKPLLSNNGRALFGYKIIIPKEEPITCPKCRTNDFKKCHSIRCPMRKEEPKQECKGSFKDCFKPLNECVCDNMENKETLEEAAERIYPNDGYNDEMWCDLGELFREKFIEGAKWQQEQDRWKTVYQETPPIHVELLVQSPEGIIHLASWRESYNIFTCQHKSESSSDWKWKTI